MAVTANMASRAPKSTKKIPYVPRSRDEMLLEWLQLYEEGWTFSQIAERYGKNRGAVSKAIRAVLEAAG